MKNYLITFLLLFQSNMLFPQTWTELGPTNRPGVMKQLFLDDETKKLYASSPDGGLWVYDDFTNNTLAWHTLTGKLENLEIRAFAVASRNILYVATRTLKLYRSTNGGNSWQELEPDSSSGMVNVIAVPYDNPSMVFLGTVNGLFKSIDTGSTWYQVMIGNEVTDIKIDPSSDSILYAGVRNFGIKKSEDAGVSWSDFFPCHPRSGSIIRIALGYKNTNGTAQTAIDRSIAVKYGDSVWLKPAGSAEFFNTGFTKKFGGGSLRTDTDIFGDWCNSINLNPFNPSEIWVGDADIHKGIVTDSDTVEWSLFTKRADKYHEDNHDFAFSKIVQDKLFKASDGGVEIYDGSKFKSFCCGLNTCQIVSIGIKNGYILANLDHNGVWGYQDITTCNDGIWKNYNDYFSPYCPKFGENGNELHNIYSDPKRNHTYYIMGTSGGDSVVLKRLIYPPNGNCQNDIKTIGYGSNGHVFFSFGAMHITNPYEDEFRDRFSFPYGQIAIDTRDESDLILGCSRLPTDSLEYRLLSSRSTDRRFPRWTVELSKDSLNPFVTVKFASPGSNIVYAMTSSGILYRKKFDPQSPLDAEAGRSDTILNGWIKRDRLNPESPILNFDINKYTDSIIYAVSKNAFYASTNRGKRWTTHTKRLHVDNYYMVLANPIDKKEIFISTSDGVYSTTTGGFSWRKLKGNLPNVKVLQIHIDHGFLYAATYGRGLWRMPLFKSQNSEIKYDVRLSVQKIKCIKTVEAFGAGDPEDLFGYIKVANYSLRGALTDITDYELWEKQDNDAIHVKQGSFKGIHQFDYSPQEWKGLTFADLASLCFTLAIKISDGENFPFGNAEYFCKNCCSDPYYEFNMGNYPPIIEGIQSMPASVHYQPVKMYGDDFFEVDLYENGNTYSSHLRLFGKLELKIHDPSNGR